MSIQLPNSIGDITEIEHRGVSATLRRLSAALVVVEVDGRETGSFIRDGDHYVARTGRGEKSHDHRVDSLEDAVFYATRR
ncbi:hypothetical protein [Microbacterium aurantiacum]|uniref:hypothetical protein n=1 Tax=Microbacterium aurantiacum TaxID=162393 RepID=UPI003D7475B0